jgi:protein gp37
MSESTIIAWTDHTFNIAWGCQKISPGCKNCYADSLSQRWSAVSVWGPGAPRRTFGEHYWNRPLKWNRLAEAAGVRARVFSSSMCDLFEDHPDITAERAKLWPLIRATPWLDWQLLTKRHERIAENLPDDWGAGYPNVWLGVSVEDQEYADLRIPVLLRLPAVVRFISYEPALGPVNLADYVCSSCDGCGGSLEQCEAARRRVDGGCCCPDCRHRALDWVIIGGESGRGYRPMDVQWARDVRAQCDAAGVAFFFKQSSAPRTEMGIELDGEIVRAYPTPRGTIPLRLI